MANNFLYPKGSEWRKWDLHVHTPASALNNQFEGVDIVDKWNKYFDKLSSLKNISVLGITDYFSIDGYLKVNAHKEQGYLKNIDLILPNVELRIVPVTGIESPINLHVIFSSDPEIIDDLESKFFSSLVFPYQNNSYKCLKSDLIKLGRKYNNNSSLEENSAYISGIEQFKVNIDQLKEIFNKNKSLKENSIIVVSNSNRDGNSGIQHSSLAATREEIYRFADCIFSGNPNDCIYFHGKGADNEIEVKRKYGSLKPCIHGSDAHKLNKICEPDLSRFTWIKADPSFTGLKQIIYEPEIRVKIQENKPEEKTNYLIIDKVRFLDKTENPKFSDEWIELNPNLNSIIGGKSAGKSLLLYYIAKTVDPIQVKEKIKGLNIPNYDLNQGVEFDFEVRWKDGVTDSLTKSIEAKKRKITYIPQMYINKVAEEGENNFYNLIWDILFQNEGFKKYHLAKLKVIDQQNMTIAGTILNYFKSLKELNNLRAEKIQIGDKDAIEKEIKKIKKQNEELEKTAGFSTEESRNYKALLQSKEKIDNSMQNLNKSIDILEKIESYFNREIDENKINIKNKLIELMNDLQDDLETLGILRVIETDSISMFDKLKNVIEKHLKFKKNQLEKLKEFNIDKNNNDKELRPYYTKFKNQESLRDNQKYLESETDKIAKINKYEKEIVMKTNEKNKFKESISNEYRVLFNTYLEIKDELDKEEYKKIEDDIELRAELGFNSRKFLNEFEDNIDKRATISNSLKFYSESNQYVYNEKDHLKNIKKTFEVLMEGKDKNLKKKTERSLKDIVEKLFDDYFYIKFDLFQKGDTIIEMSPGKRGLILLKLYLQLSNSKSPILIDQPEENLDNRTIYSELNDFFRNKKISRQIIIISHNPNLVVSTDSEIVIVANQDGQQLERDNRKYRFEFVTGALENQFEILSEKGILFKKGIKQHVCEILEGGEEAFEKREQKYGFR